MPSFTSRWCFCSAWGYLRNTQAWRQSWERFSPAWLLPLLLKNPGELTGRALSLLRGLAGR